MLSRRSVLTAGALSATSSLMSGCQAPATYALGAGRVPNHQTAFDPNDVAQSTKAFLKLSGSLGNELVRLWFTGKVYAYVPGEPTRELFYLDGFYLTRYEALSDGTHKHTRFEITIKRDLETGALLEHWDNPYTGRRDTVKNSVGGPQYKIYNKWGFDRPEKMRGPDTPRPLEWMIFDDDAWLTWDLFLRFKNPITLEQNPLEYSGEFLELTNLTNYKGKLSDIENPDMINAPGIMFWNGVSSWQPWMQMGQMPGALLYKVIGVKVDQFDIVPSHIYEAAESAFPGHLTERVQWAEGNYEWFDIVGAEWTDE